MTKLEEKQEELKQMKSHHKAAWETYGSELSAGDMIAKEKRLEEEIESLSLKEEKDGN